MTLLFCFAIAFVMLPLELNAQDKSNEGKKIVMPWTKRKQMETNSQKKDYIIDSLLNIIDNYQAQLERESREHQELIDFYKAQDSKVVTAAGLSPEEYTADITDSLLNIWYIYNSLNVNVSSESYDMDNVRFESNVPDSVYIARIQQMNSFITLPYNETVRNYIILYAEKSPTRMKQMLGLAKFYMPIFEETFNRYGLPEELKYMSVIESALNPTAFSRAGAAGIWQFMHTTGKTYGLQINSFVDERYDVVKAADAAARYLKDAYNFFGDWCLAISSYNCGSGNVNKAIRRSGSREFWDIYPYLPRETRGYVPAFVGAMYAFEFHKEHGLMPDNVGMPVHVDTFEVKKMLHFKQINDVVGIPEETLKSLNPQYTHHIIPGADQTYILRIPHIYTAKFVEYEDSVYRYKASELFNPTVLDNIKNFGSANSEQITYRVKKGDYLGKIAARYHVSVNSIKKWNNLRNNNLSIGQRLVIYQKSSKPATSSVQPKEEEKKTEAVAADSTTAVQDSTMAEQSAAVQVQDSVATEQSATVQVQDSVAVQKTVIYTVKSGDTLYDIAQNYPGVSAKDIMILNGVTSKIKPGMRLKIPVK